MRLLVVLLFAGVVGYMAATFYHVLLVRRLWLDVALRGLRRYLEDSSRGISRRDLVLDVGSGDRPHIRADLICDRYEESWERSAGLQRDRPLVIADITALPFRDSAFDVVICQHLVEHLETPEAAFAELSRVGRRGLIRTPSPLAEKLFSRDVHRWMVSTVREGTEETLRLQQKANPSWDPDVTRQLGSSHDFWHFFGRNVEMMETVYRWVGHISYRVERLEGAAWDGRPAIERPGDSPASRQLFDRNALRQMFGRVAGFLYRRVFLGRPAAVNWEEILACPACRGRVRVLHGVLCSVCQTAYPLVNGVPIMLIPEAKGLPPTATQA